jgi:Ni/Co efflux regulator RcnB
MFARSLRKLLSVSVVAVAAFAAMNLAAPSEANADPGRRGGRGHYGHHHGHGHHHHHHRGGHYHGGYHSGGYGGYYHGNRGFSVQIAPPIRYYDNYPGSYRSYVRPGVSLHWGW